jgi:hypothetical protein
MAKGVPGSSSTPHGIAHAAYMRKWRAKNKKRARESSRAGNKKYSALHPEKRTLECARYNDKLRQAIIEAFGGQCVQCGFSDPRALQLDHINGDGRRLNDWRKGNRPHWDLRARYTFIVTHPEEAHRTLQLLCANCNWIKRVEKKEYRRPRSRREE